MTSDHELQRIIRGIRNPEMKELVRSAYDAGWHLQVTGGNHIALYPPSRTISPVIMSMTSNGKGRAYMNTRAKLRARGLDT
jgi:hypothetical protein